MPLSTINKPLALSLGEPAGIGPEIILKSWMQRNKQSLPVFFVCGTEDILLKTARKLKLDIPMEVIADTSEAAAVFARALPIFDLGIEAEFQFSVPATNTAAITIQAINKAVDLIFSDKAAGLVTAPIQKSILYDAGFTAPGHTEYLAELCQNHTARHQTPVMMIVSEYLRVAPLTIHMALNEVAQAITPALIKNSCEEIHAALIKDFGFQAPRVAVAGLNPHAGEGGTMGHEDEDIIRPALDQLRDQGMNIQGPLPADSLFHAAARAKYDAALCMYHDQALIPAKTLDFDGGVNVTLGLPLVRTSPDHGTALDIAGKNLARPDSMINAIKQAEKICLNRQNWKTRHV